MTVIELFRRETRGQLGRLAIVGAVAGLSNVSILLFSVEAARAGGSLPMVLAFVLAVVLYVVCARSIFHRVTEIVEHLHHRIRVDLNRKIERAELTELERLGVAELYERLSALGSTFAMTAGPIASLLVSGAILCGALVYMAWISLPGMALITATVVLGMAVFLRRNAAATATMREQAGIRVKFYAAFADLLHGSREIKFSRRRGADVVDELRQRSARLRDVSISTERILDDNQVLANLVQHAALFVIAFVIAELFALSVPELIALIITVNYGWDALGGIVLGVPGYTRLGVALELVDQLHAKLDTAIARSSNAVTCDPWPDAAAPLELDGLQFHYPRGSEPTPFAIGPLDLRIEPGEIVFLVGGNGSGKSTLFKVLTGLYLPSGGQLRLAGSAVDPDNIAAYRQRFSTIFTEPYLFGKLFGMLDTDPASVRGLLAQMQIQDKTEYTEQGFSTLALSTGQRKRLAMVVALLEDRPIFALDEWAADQDPEFREFFYLELLPTLAARGKTVIAVSHDDRYHGVADMVVTMDAGKIRTIERRIARSANQVLE
jgi:putative ATP-binding cassette transporter